MSDPDLLPASLAGLFAGLCEKWSLYRRRPMIGMTAALSESLLTRVQLAQKTVLLNHPALLMSSTLKLQLQEIFRALVQKILRALESDGTERQREGLRSENRTDE